MDINLRQQLAELELGSVTIGDVTAIAYNIALTRPIDFGNAQVLVSNKEAMKLSIDELRSLKDTFYMLVEFSNVNLEHIPYAIEVAEQFLTWRAYVALSNTSPVLAPIESRDISSVASGISMVPSDILANLAQARVERSSLIFIQSLFESFLNKGV